MSEMNQEDGVIVVLLERMRTQRLPRAISIKERVERGERLDNFDIQFLQEVFDDSRHLQSKWDAHPELHQIISQVIGIYHEITRLALENEEQAETRPNLT